MSYNLPVLFSPILVVLPPLVPAEWDTVIPPENLNVSSKRTSFEISGNVPLFCYFTALPPLREGRGEEKLLSSCNMKIRQSTKIPRVMFRNAFVFILRHLHF